jgi:FixJ family two-component response regulator
MHATRGHPKAALAVTPEDRQILERWTRRRTTAQGLALRSRIVLCCASGVTNMQVAEELHVTNATRRALRILLERLRGRLARQCPGQ